MPKTKMNELKNRAAVHELLRSSEAILAEAKARWPIDAHASADDLSVHAMLLGDAGDHVEIACALQSGGLDAAGELAGKLETGSRDKISPLWVADYLGFELCPTVAKTPGAQYDPENYRDLERVPLDEWLDKVHKLVKAKKAFHYASDKLGSPKFDNGIDALCYEKGMSPQEALDWWRKQ